MSGLKKELKVVDGHYPGFLSIVGAAYPVSIVTSASDLSLDDFIGRTNDAHLMSAAPGLLEALEECLPCIGWVGFSDEELVREHELGNGYAMPILRARNAIKKARANQ